MLRNHLIVSGIIALGSVTSLMYARSSLTSEPSSPVVLELSALPPQNGQRKSFRTLLPSMYLAELEAMAEADPIARGELIESANRLQGDELLPFWKKLAIRKVQSSEETKEGSITNCDGQDSESKGLHRELATAIRNLGLLAETRGEAREVLAEIIRLKKSYPLFVREYALQTLNDADKSAVTGVVKSLEAGDPLKQSLVFIFQEKQ